MDLGLFLAYNVYRMKKENLTTIKEKSVNVIQTAPKYVSKFVIEQIKTLGIDESTAILYLALITGAIVAVPVLIHNLLKKKNKKTE